MKIPDDAVIPDGKITNYLLVLKAKDDKSQFLAQAGFTQNNPDLLRAAIRELANNVEAIPDIQNEYGQFSLVIGEITGLDNCQIIATKNIKDFLNSALIFPNLSILKPEQIVRR